MGTSLLTLGTRAMTANQAALATIGHNISNANTEGYSRQRVEFATAGGQFTGVGFFGRGVDVASVTRSHDAFLTREAISTRSVAAGDEARSRQLEMLESVFPTGDKGFGQAAGALLNAFVDVANKPDDLSARQVVLSRADELASRFRAASEQLQELQTGVSQDLENSVDAVNSLARQIAAVNQQIAESQGSLQPPNDLLDQRDQLIGKMAQYVQLTTVAADDGSVNVYIAGGQRIVLGNEAGELQLQPDMFDPNRSQVALVEGSTTRVLPEDSFGSGSLAGLMRFQVEDLVDARNLLGQLATAVATRLNEQQALGLDLRQPAGSGAPLFQLGAPTVLPASTNQTDASGVFLAAPTITIVDATRVQASDYELRADPGGAAGVYQLTRLSDGQVSSVGDGDEVDGMRIDIGSPAPAALDRFRLQPVGGAITDMASVLDDPRGIAAASPVTATLGSGNTGTASVGALAVTDPAHDNSLSASIAFTSADGDFDWELRDASNNVTSSGSGTWTAGQPITLNGFELKLNGVPADGDTITVGKTSFPAANNGNALAMVALRDAAMVGLRSNPDGSTYAGESITDAYASAIADIGVRVQGASSAAGISRSVADAAEKLRADKAGVNLDEEAARLIQFQQAYQAAAKVLQVAQSIFDTMLSATGG